MQEVELTSELTILGLDGTQDKKKSVNSFYDRYDDNYPGRAKSETRFRSVIDSINDANPSGLAQTEFRRVPLFYSLYGAVYHRMFGVMRINLATNATGR